MFHGSDPLFLISLYMIQVLRVRPSPGQIELGTLPV
ncbi:hypothetical protein LINGRAPRIM_LOCUS6 [Linum grandiflorum]